MAYKKKYQVSFSFNTGICSLSIVFITASLKELNLFPMKSANQTLIIGDIFKIYLQIQQHFDFILQSSLFCPFFQYQMNLLFL